MNATETRLNEQLSALRLLTVQEHYAALASEAAQKQWTHVDYLARLIDGEAQRRQELAIQRRMPQLGSPASRPSTSLTGTGPRKSIAPRCRTSSAWPFSQRKPTWFLWAAWG